MRIFLAALLTTALSAQSTDLFSKAPPDVDAALRAKVTEFYNMQMEGKFRAAEKLVCEDSKDAYFDAAKRKYKSFEMIKVSYDAGFQSAIVVSKLESDFFTRQGPMNWVFPWTTHWRIEVGTWCHYFPPKPTEVQTPFGVSKSAGQPKDPSFLGTPTAMAADPKQVMDQIARQVVLSSTKMKLKGYEASTDGIEIRNGTSGPLEVSFTGHEFPGLKITVDPATIPAGGKGRVKAEYEPKDISAKPTYNFMVMIEPVAYKVPVTIIFDLQEEVKKALPPGAIRK